MQKYALVTGANRGLGLETARQLCDLGYHVIFTARDKNKLQKAVEKTDLSKVQYTLLALNVNQKSSIAECCKIVKEKIGRLDVLVNNAGINYDTWHGALDADLEECHQTIETNLFGPWRMCQAFASLLKESKSGRIVNVSSGSGSLTVEEPGTPGYSISKAGLNVLTIKLAHELKDAGILVNAVCPGWVKTDMGGKDAPRSLPEGAKSIVWAVTLSDDGPSGGFYRDGKRIAW